MRAAVLRVLCSTLALLLPGTALAQAASDPHPIALAPAAIPGVSPDPGAGDAPSAAPEPQPDSAPPPSQAPAAAPSQEQAPAVPSQEQAPAAPSQAETPAPASQQQSQPTSPPAVPPPTVTQGTRRLTPEEMERVRAALAQQKKTQTPRRHGDPTAHFTVGLDVSAIRRPDGGFERFDFGHTSPRFGLFLGYDLLRFSEQLVLAGELGAGLEHDESEHLLDANTSGSLDSQSLYGGLALRWDALPWLSPQLRAWGGASLFQLEISGTTVDFDTGHATSPFGALGVGFLLHTPPRTFETAEGKLAALQLGVLIEVGYALRKAIDFSLRTKPDPRSIEVIDATLGKLTLSGGYLRFAGVVRF